MDQNIFEEIKHVNEFRNEYWKARELYKILWYTEYWKFLPTIKKAKTSCENSWDLVDEHFSHMREPQKSYNQYWETKWQIIEDIKLSRFACYLIIQNADPKKQMVALGQTYFAIQTRKQEVHEELLEDTRRVELRDEMKKHNIHLAKAAKNAWVENQLIMLFFKTFDICDCIMD